MSEYLIHQEKGDCDPYTCTKGNAYCFHHESRGTALIFNHSVFDHLPNRHGSKADRQNIVRSLEYLGLNVQLYVDSTRDEVLKIFKVESQRDHEDEDCFVCVFMTHGSEGHVYCQDYPLQISSILEYFNQQNCPSLSGKPKLFFINACRGEKLDVGVDVVDSINEEDDNSAPTIPPEKDYLVACSVVSGYASARDFRKGSCFIAALSEILHQKGKSMDLVKLLTRVNCKVALEFERKGGTKQMSCIYNMLTKDVIF